MYHQKAIELRYKGYSYNAIEEALGFKFSISTLQKYFMFGGMLHVPYLQFCQKMDQLTIDDVRKELKRDAAYAPKLIRGILQKALKQGNLELAYKIITDYLDRTGVPIVKAIQKEEKPAEPAKHLTKEELHERIRESGTDPLTGLPLAGAAAPQQN